jgi:hypothetical protein
MRVTIHSKVLEKRVNRAKVTTMDLPQENQTNTLPHYKTNSSKKFWQPAINRIKQPKTPRKLHKTK